VSRERALERFRIYYRLPCPILSAAFRRKDAEWVGCKRTFGLQVFLKCFSLWPQAWSEIWFYIQVQAKEGKANPSVASHRCAAFNQAERALLERFRFKTSNSLSVGAIVGGLYDKLVMRPYCARTDWPQPKLILPAGTNRQ
jgi:hypothetical protein